MQLLGHEPHHPMCDDGVYVDTPHTHTGKHTHAEYITSSFPSLHTPHDVICVIPPLFPEYRSCVTTEGGGSQVTTVGTVYVFR